MMAFFLLESRALVTDCQISSERSFGVLYHHTHVSFAACWLGEEVLSLFGILEIQDAIKERLVWGSRPK
jgi:hypothetical protein